MKKLLIALFITVSLTVTLFPAVSRAAGVADTIGNWIGGNRYTQIDTQRNIITNSNSSPAEKAAATQKINELTLPEWNNVQAWAKQSYGPNPTPAQVYAEAWKDYNNCSPLTPGSGCSLEQKAALLAVKDRAASEDTTAVANAQIDSKTGCKDIISTFTACAKSFLYQTIDTVGNAILGVAAWILGVCGVLFNYIILAFVVQMKTRIVEISAIYSTWQIVRDLANMFFIFILLIIAIQTILDIGYNYKTVLRNVILVALFINFSFFFTGLMIDASNIIALQFYNGFAGTNADTTSGGVSGKIRDSLGLGTIYNAAVTGAGKDASVKTPLSSTIPLSSSDSVGGFLITVIMGSILMIVTGGILLASAILILYRFVELIILLMFSPLAFATLTLPSLRSQGWNEWWTRLTKQLIFAPVYFMFLWVTINVITSNIFTVNTKTMSFTEVFNGNGGAIMGLLANYVLVIMMLIYSLTLASKLGANASGIKLATSVSKGFNGFFAKHTAGRGAAWVDKKWAKSTIPILGGNSFLGSKLRNVTTAAAAKKDYGQGSFVDYQEGEKKRKTANATQRRINDFERTYGRGMDALNNPIAVGATQAQIDEHKRDIENLANWAKSAQPKDLTNVKAKDVVALIKAGFLNADKMKGLMDEKNISHTDKEKDSFREAFSAGATDALATHASAEQAHATAPTATTAAALAKATKELGETINNLGEKGIEFINPKLINSDSFVQMASQKQYEKILENAVATDRSEIKKTRLAPITDAFAAGIAQPPSQALKNKAIEHFGRMTGAEMAKLDDAIIQNMFQHVEAVEKLSTKKLTEAADANMDINKMNKIVQAIDTGHAAGNTKASRLHAWKSGPGLGVI